MSRPSLHPSASATYTSKITSHGATRASQKKMFGVSPRLCGQLSFQPRGACCWCARISVRLLRIMRKQKGGFTSARFQTPARAYFLPVSCGPLPLKGSRKQPKNFKKENLQLEFLATPPRINKLPDARIFAHPEISDAAENKKKNICRRSSWLDSTSNVARTFFLPGESFSKQKKGGTNRSLPFAHLAPKTRPGHGRKTIRAPSTTRAKPQFINRDFSGSARKTPSASSKRAAQLRQSGPEAAKP